LTSPALVAVERVSDQLLGRLIDNAFVTLCLSPHESLSYICLDSVASGTPVIALSLSAVPAAIVQESGGGLVVDSYADIVGALTTLNADEALRTLIGQSGAGWSAANTTSELFEERVRNYLANIK